VGLTVQRIPSVREEAILQALVKKIALRPLMPEQRPSVSVHGYDSLQRSYSLYRRLPVYF
jgi:hypothetical protein